jgi:hypothetical protein
MHNCLTDIIESNLKFKRKFNWKKKGLIYSSEVDNFTHASHPCIKHINDNKFLIAFTSRDKNKKSHIYSCFAELNNSQLEITSTPRLVLNPGERGFFDCDGVISVCFVDDDFNSYLYYVGWQNLPDNMWICDTGRVILDRDSFKFQKEFLGPIIGRDKNNPLFAAATAFHYNNGVWQTWYNSGIKWHQEEESLKHYYGIHYGTSLNGVDWTFEKGLCLPFADEYEYAFGRPSVYVHNGIYLMWFAHRASKYISTYRIGFAFSYDGKNWNRNDEMSGIDISNEGWDSEMICYPYLFEFKNKLYMLYNGNDYGKTGFGLAVLEE